MRSVLCSSADPIALYRAEKAKRAPAVWLTPDVIAAYEAATGGQYVPTYTAPAVARPTRRNRPVAPRCVRCGLPMLNRAETGLSATPRCGDCKKIHARELQRAREKARRAQEARRPRCRVTGCTRTTYRKGTKCYRCASHAATQRRVNDARRLRDYYQTKGALPRERGRAWRSVTPGGSAYCDQTPNERDAA